MAPLAILAALAAMALYLPSTRFSLQILDDPQYVSANAYVLYPTWNKLVAFFAEVTRPSTVGGYYQPLTMASLMLDRVIEGALAGAWTPAPDPFVYHFTNVLFHGLNAALVFLLLFKIVHRQWIALACALVFAAHPLNVEVVSWVCQRKALLSTFLSLLTILAYGRHAQRGGGRWYTLSFVFFFLALLAKPTALLLPGALLLADVWPLHRFSRRAVLEKIPFFLASAVIGFVSYRSQTALVDMTVAGHHRSALATVLIACHNITFYLAKSVLPIRLCPQYLFDENDVTLAAAPFAAGLAGTLAIAALFYWAYRNGKCAIWTSLGAFILLIGPTLGPVRFMNMIAGDRFVYLPMIMLLVLLGELLRRAEHRARTPAMVCISIVIALFARSTIRQQTVWTDSHTYYQSIIDRFPDSPVGHYGIGNAYLDLYERSFLEVAPDQTSQETWLAHAEESYLATLDKNTNYDHAYYRLGHIAIIRGHIDNGIDLIRRGLALPDADPEGYYFLGLAHSHAGQYELAIPAYEKCIERRPSWVEVRRNLANALLRTGRAAESLQHYEALYELNPTDMDGLQNWGVALLAVDQPAEAIRKLQGVIHVREQLALPGNGEASARQEDRLADALYTLAGAQAQSGQSKGALESLERALRLKPQLREDAERNAAFAALRTQPIWKQLGRPD